MQLIHRRKAFREFNPLSLFPSLWFSDTGNDDSLWSDISGNGNDATQSTASYRPSIVTNVLNGKQIRRFDGTDDFLSYETSVFDFYGSATVFAVTAVVTGGINEYGSIIAEFKTGVQYSIGCQTNQYPNNEFNPATDVYAPGGVQHGTGYSGSGGKIICWLWTDWENHKTNGETKIRVNGAAGTPTAYGSNPVYNSGTPFLHIGRFSDLSQAENHLSADIAEIIVFPDPLAIGDVQKVEQFFSSKYGITLS